MSLYLAKISFLYELCKIIMSLLELVNYWFTHENIWFGAKLQDDQYITQKFGHLVIDNMEVNTFLQEENLNLLLGLVLVYDQIIRHVFRNNQNKIKKLSIKSRIVSTYILNNNLDIYFTPAQKCFILMPYRHTFQFEYLNYVYQKIKTYQNEQPSKYYDRFYTATIKARSPLIAQNITPEEINNSVTEEKILSVLDPNCIHNLSVLKTPRTNHPIYQTFKETIRRLQHQSKIVISLSGGVDSMISSYILKNLSKNGHKFELVAVHIDYGNREDNAYENEFIKRWCKLIDIKCFIRHIEELKRNRQNGRNDYETITKQFRFDMYRAMNAPVFLGHNQDDCLENIIRNIAQERSCGNLRGMEEISKIDNVLIVRPMLNTTKNAIKQFAKDFYIPHLPNSTPDWSQRGRIRTILVEGINNFDPSIITGLLKIADNMQEIYNMYENSVVQTFIKNNINGNKISLDKEAVERTYGFIFWKDVIHAFFQMQTQKLKIPSNKSIESMVCRINSNQYGKIKMTKETSLLFNKINLEIIS